MSLVEFELPNLSTRRLEPEVMDDPTLDKREHQRALKGLARVHALTGTTSWLWKPIGELVDQRQLQQISILDVGCGDGSLLRSFYHQARKRGLNVQLIGCDFSRQALELAQVAAEREGIPIELHCVDITQSPLPRSADVVLCSLFLHHFTDQQVVDILDKLANQAVHLVQVEDLLRSQLGYYLCLVGVHLLSRSPVVHTDGPLSVRAAFTLAEMQNLLDDAGLQGARVRRHWPERFIVQYRVNASQREAGNT